MKQTMKRFLSVVSATALLLVCLIPCFVLPVAAEQAANVNLFPYGDFEEIPAETWKCTVDKVDQYVDFSEMTGYSGKGFEIAADDFKTYTLASKFFKDIEFTEGKTYLFKVKVKGGKATVRFNADKWRQITTTATEGWRSYALVITDPKTTAASSLAATILRDSAATTATVIDDIEFIEVNNETNLMPAQEFGLESSWLKNYYSKGCTIVKDPDDETNAALMMPVGLNEMWFSLNISSIPRDTKFELTYKHKGAAATHFWSGNTTFLTTVGSTAACTEWTTTAQYCSAGSANGQPNGSYTFMFRTDTVSSPLYLDDITVRIVDDATELKLADTTVEAGKSVSLPVTTTPAHAYPGKLTWSGDNQSVIKIANGAATGLQGTATIDSVTASVTSDLGLSAEGKVSLTYPKELIQNGDFESTTSSAWSAHKAFVKAGVGVNGSTGLEFPANTHGDYYYKGGLYFKPNATYLMTYKANTTATADTLAMWFANTSGITNTSVYFRAEDGWTTYARVFNTDAAPHVAYQGDGVTLNQGWQFMHRIFDNTEPVYMDDIQITLLDRTDDSERITNGTFDEDIAILGPWGFSGLKPTLAVGEGKDGTNAMRLPAATASAQNTSLQDAVGPLLPNRTYRLSFDAKGTGSAFLWLNSQKINDVTLVSTNAASGNYFGPLNDWKHVEFDFATGEAPKLSDGWFALAYGQSPAGEMLIDNASFKLLAAASSVTVTTESVTLAPGSEEQIKYTVTPADAQVADLTFTSGNEAVATVSATGVITGVAEGETTITVASVSCSLNTQVTVKVTDYGINLITDGDFEGEKLNWRIDAQVGEGDGVDGSNCLKLTGESEKIARYNLAVLAKMVPNALYEFSYDYKTEGACEVQFFADAGTLKSGSYQKATEWKHFSQIFETGATITPNKTWEMAFIRRQVGAGEGTAYIDNVSLVRKQAATAVTLTNKTVTATALRSVALSYTTEPAGAAVTKATWTSSDESVATVDANGVVKTINYGEATITVTCGSLSDECVVKVDPDAEMVINGDFESDDLSAWFTGISLTNDGQTGRGADFTGTKENGDTPHYFKGQLLKLVPNSTYTFSYDYKGKAPNFWWNSGTAANNNKDVTVTNTVTTDLGNDWKHVVKTVTTGEAPKFADNYSFSLGGYYAQTTTIDNVSFIKGEPAVYHTVTFVEKDGKTVISTVQVKDGDTVVAPKAPEIGGFIFKEWDTPLTNITADVTITAVYTEDAGYGINLIPDGDFEGDTLNWRGSGEVGQGEGVDGSNCLKVTGEAEKETRYNLAVLSKMVPNAIYEFSYDYKTEGACNVQFYADAGTLKTGSLMKADDWKHFSQIIETGDTITPNKTWEMCFIRRQVGTGEGTIYVDNISLVRKPAATAVTLSESTLSATALRNVQLAYTVEPAGAAVTTATWTSSNEAVATVDTNGMVKTLDYGKTTITVTCGKLTSTCEITVDPKLELFINGDFESDDKSNWFSAVTIADEGGNPDKALDITSATAGQEKPNYVKGQLFKLVPNSTYILTYDYKGAAPHLWWNDGTANNNNKDITHAAPVTTDLTDGWKQVTVEVTTGEAPKFADNYSFSLGGNNNSSLVDNVSFKLKAAEEPTGFTWGDATGEGTVDSKDIVRLRKYIAAYDYETKTSTVDIGAGADATGDGSVDSKDIVRLRKYIAAYDYETGTSTVHLGPEEN